MENKVEIVSWLLTRRCNLSCSYCAISRNYDNKPKEYPDMQHYYQNEMSTETIIELLRRMKLHNPDAFHLFYGGEPSLRSDLPEILSYCNKNDINYTIITNNSDGVQKMISNLFEKVDGQVMGFTSSVDPIILNVDDVNQNQEDDRFKKSKVGFDRLKQIKSSGMVKDVVAEITVDRDSVHLLYDLVKLLSDSGINSDITFVDVAKSKYYDFSNVTDHSTLVYPTEELGRQLDKIIDEGLDVHMAKSLFKEFWNILPSNLDCELEDGIHNITIDADGSMRMCLRIRAVLTPQYQAQFYIKENGTLDPSLKENLIKDKEEYCLKCNWSCQIMSKLLFKNSESVEELVHSNKRK